MHILKFLFAGTLVAVQFLNNANAAAPVVDWFRPTNGASFGTGTPILLRAIASDSDGTLSSIDFVLNGSNLLRRISGSLTNGTYSFMWSNAPAGTHQLHGEAEDDNGERGVSAPVQIMVTNTPPPNSLPVVSLFQPTNGAVFSVGTPILLSANASDSDGTLTSIEFFAGGTLLRTISGTLTNGIYSFQWTNAPAGMYFLRAEAVDNAGGRGISSSVQVSVSGVTNCQIAISPPARSHSSGVSTGIVTVTTSNCLWVASTTNSWITILSPVTNLGSGTVTYEVASNPGPARNGYIRVGGQTFTVAQAGITNPANALPLVSLIQPTNGAVFAQGPPIILTANATDSDGTVSYVDFYATPTNQPSTTLHLGRVSGPRTNNLYTLAWSNAPAGSFNLQAVAGDNLGARGYSDRAEIVIGANPPSNALPVVNWLGPTNGAVLQPGTPALLTANASDPDGTISYVDFYAGSNYLGRGVKVLTNSNYDLTWTNPPAGVFQLRAEAADNAGGRSGSIPVRVWVGTPGSVDLGVVEVPTIGHVMNSNSVVDFLIDQDQGSGGGGVLRNVSVNWDTNIEFKLTVTAPPCMKFEVTIPPGKVVRFGGFLWWESTRGGFSPPGQVTVSFTDLQGAAFDFSVSDCALSDSHGFFGFPDIDGAQATNSFSFTSITLTGAVAPQYTGGGSENYVPHLASSLYLTYSSTETSDPGSFVAIVPTCPLPLARMVIPPGPNGLEFMIYGRPGLTHVVECSVDTVTWTAISTHVMPPKGSMSVNDASASTEGSRFYRVVELP